jgi:glycosyltransferase involved in cell wall biosynthesis
MQDKGHAVFPGSPFTPADTPLSGEGNRLPDLSVIVTVYNMEPYLAQCLDSVVGMTLDPARVEIIIVDDKSTDGSLDIARAYAAKHPNISIVALPENTPGGVGFPANIGMKRAKGKYIGFVDGDDYADPTMFAKLLAAAEPAEADLAICDFSRYCEQDNTLAASDDGRRWSILFTPEFASLPLQRQKSVILHLSPVPWRKIYRRAFIEKHGIAFPVGDFFFEDSPFHWFNVLFAEKIVCVPEALITHRFQRPGQTTGQLEQRVNMAIHAENIKNFMLMRGFYQEYGQDFEIWARMLISNMSRILPEPLFHKFYRHMAETVGVRLEQTPP